MMRSMIFRKKTLIPLVSGFLSAMISGVAVAAVSGEPLPFDQYTVTGGQISAACGNWTKTNGDVLNVVCSEPTISDGMLQREVTVTSLDPDYNGTYVQFIMVESGATGDAAAAHFSAERGNIYFSGEDFIKMNNRGEGIASKQTILKSDFNDATLVEDRFEMDTVYKNGWASGIGSVDPWIDLNQTVSQMQYDDPMAIATSAFELFNDSISIQSVGPDLNNTQVGIDQLVLIQDEISPADDAVQKFKHSRLAGIYTDTSAPDAALVYDEFGALIGAEVINGSPQLPGGTNNGVIAWDAGEEISATWVGVDSVNETASVIDWVFGFTRYQNHSQTIGDISTSLVTFSSPEAGGSLGGWDMLKNKQGQPLFGSAPAMADISVVAMTDSSVMNPAVFLGAANLDYIANSDPSLTLSPGALTIAASDYNRWTVDNGVFTASCPLWADSCDSNSVNEEGFYQRLISADGELYVQTIFVGDTDTVGSRNPLALDYEADSIAFRMESFVKQGMANGIASNMHMAERDADTSYQLAPMTTDLPVTAGDFTNDVVMNLGWANRGSIFVARDMNGDGVITQGEGITEPHASIDIKLGLVVHDAIQTDAVSMAELFTFERGLSQADKRVTMSNKVGTQIGFINPIVFKSVTVSGAYQRTARADIVDPFILPGNNSDLSWSAGDALQATWMAGQYATSPLVPVSQVETTQLANLTTGERISFTETQAAPLAPNNWLIDPFLAEPVYP